MTHLEHTDPDVAADLLWPGRPERKDQGPREGAEPDRGPPQRGAGRADNVPMEGESGQSRPPF